MKSINVLVMATAILGMLLSARLHPAPVPTGATMTTTVKATEVILNVGYGWATEKLPPLMTLEKRAR